MVPSEGKTHTHTHSNQHKGVSYTIKQNYTATDQAGAEPAADWTAAAGVLR